MMRPRIERDTYSTTCVCGAAVNSPTTETTCEECGRELDFRWGSAADVYKDGRGHRQAEEAR